MSALVVEYKNGIAFEAKTRDHSVVIDLPCEKGGEDRGMTPPELFIASLGSCIGVYVVRYCQAAKLDPSDLHIELDWELSDDKTRIAKISATLTLPHADAGKRENALLHAAEHCLVHHTISGNPEIRISLKKS